MPDFFWNVRVYYEDTDAGGIVYYANYLKFMERARTEWLRALGVDQVELMRAEQLMFVVISAELQYHKPARFDDELCVSCRVLGTTRTSVTFEQEICRGGSGGELLVSGRLRAACVDSSRLRPKAIPTVMLEEFR